MATFSLNNLYKPPAHRADSTGHKQNPRTQGGASTPGFYRLGAGVERSTVDSFRAHSTQASQAHVSSSIRHSVDAAEYSAASTFTVFAAMPR